MVKLPDKKEDIETEDIEYGISGKKSITKPKKKILGRWDRRYAPTNRGRMLKAWEIAQVLEECKGLVTTTAKRLGVASGTIRNRIAKSPDLQKVQNESLETVVDFAESKLLKKIEEGDLQATMFFLKSKGKHRGYSDRVDGSNVNISVAPQKTIVFQDIDNATPVKIKEREVKEIEEQGR